MSDGSIAFDTKIDTTGFKSGYKELKAQMKSIEQEMKAVDKQVSSTQKALEKQPNNKGLQQDLSKLQQQYADLAKEHASLFDKSEKMSPGLELSDQLDKAISKYQALIDKQTQMATVGKTGTDSASWQNLQYQIEKTKEEIDSLIPEFAKYDNVKAVTIGGAVDQMAGKQANAASQYQSDSEQKNLQSEIDKTVEKYNQLIEKQKEAMDSGVNPNTSGFKKKNAEIDKTKAKLDELIAKQKQYDSGKAGALQTSVDAKSEQNKSDVSNYQSSYKKPSFKDKLGNAFSGIKGSASDAGNALTAFGRKWLGLGAMVRRMAIRQIIMSGINALKTGFTNLSAYSQETANSLNSIKLSATTAFNGLAAAVAPALNALAPMITTIIDMFTSACNAVARFFAMLTGKSTYVKAVKNAGTVASANKAVGDSAKQAAKDEGKLADIDEIHDITPNNSSSGGSGGGGGGAGGGGGGFVTESVGSGTWDDIKAAIDKGDWEGVGKAVADHLNKAIASIDWAGWGTKLGTYINNAVLFAYGFLKNIDTNAIGADLATLLNNTIAQIDASKLGASIVMVFERALDFLIGFVTTFDWGQLAAKLSDGIKGAFDEMTLWLNSYDWSSLGSQLYQDIKDVVTNIDWGGIATSLFTFLGTAIRSAAQFIGGFFGDIGADIKQWFDDNIAGQDFGEVATNILNAIATGFQNINQWVQDNIWTPFITALTGNSDLAEKLAPIFGTITTVLLTFLTTVNLVKGVWLLFLDAIFNVSKAINVLSGVFSFLTSPIGLVALAITGLIAVIVLLVTHWDQVKETAQKVWDKIVDVWQGIGDWFGEKFDAVKQGASDLKDKVSQHFSDARTSVNDAWKDCKDWFGDKWDGIKKGASDLKEHVGKKFSDAWSTTKGVWDGSKKWFADKWDGIKTDTSTMKDKVTDNFSKAWDNSSKAWSNTKKFFGDVWGGIQDVFGKTADWFGQTFGGAWQKVKDVFSSGGMIFNGIKEGIASAFKGIVNSLIDGINSVVSVPFNAINTALSGLRGVKILDLHPFSWLPSISVPRIPHLATGTVVPPNAGEFMAMLGDNKRETEVVSPLSTMKQAVREAMDEDNSNKEILKALNILIAVVEKKHILVSDVGKAAVDYINDETDRTGDTPLKFSF